MTNSVTQVWRGALRRLLTEGKTVSPLSAGATWRGRANRELVGFQTTIPMDRPVVLSAARKLGFKFLAAEAAWICSGDNRVSTIAPYARKIADMSDDGRRFFGAYGPKFIEQLSFVVETLIKDPASRQAVISIWREQPRPTRDTPCTLSWQFLLRDGRLRCVASMRSSDIWTGWVYDIFNFSMVAACVALELRERAQVLLADVPSLPAADHSGTVEEVTRKLEMLRAIRLGDLTLTAGSQHLYEVDVDGAQAVLTEAGDQEIAPLDLGEFANADDLVQHLWDLARGLPYDGKHFLRELFR